MSKGRRRHRDAPGVERDTAGHTDVAAEAFHADVEAVDIEPVDDDGVRTVAIITILFAVAFVVLALRMDALEAEGRNWWLWTCLAGVGLGLLGLEYTRKRRDAIEAAAAAHEAEPTDAEAADAEPGAVEPAEAASVAAEPVADGPSEPPAERSSPEAITRPIDTGPQPVQPAFDTQRPVAPERPERPEQPGPPESSTVPGTGELGRPIPQHRPPPSGPEPQPRAPEPEPRPWNREPATPPQDTPPPDDDEPLLDTTLGGGRRARRYDLTDEIDEVTEGGGEQYRGRRARRSDSA